MEIVQRDAAGDWGAHIIKEGVGGAMEVICWWASKIVTECNPQLK